MAYGSAQFMSSGNRPNYLLLLLKYLFRPKIDSLSIITDNKSIMAFNLIWLYENVDLFNTLIKDIIEMELPPAFIGHSYPYEKLPEALRMLQSGKTIGKVVVVVGGSYS